MSKRIVSIDFIFNETAFATDVFAARKELRMSGEDAAEMLPFDKSTLYKYEKGMETSPKMENFIALCNLYDLDPRDYFHLAK